MPQVPVYQESVGNDGGMSGRVQSYATPDAAGAGVAAALGGVANDVGDAGKYLTAWEQTQDEARAKQISTQFTPAVRTALYDPTNGFLGQQGVNALNAREGTMQQINSAYDDAVNQAQNPRQRALLEQSLGAQRDTAFQQIDEHTTQQGKVYYTAASAAVAAEHGKSYVTMLGTDPQAAQAHLQAAEAETIRANTFAGLGAPGEAMALQKLHTTLYSQVLDGQLSAGTAAGVYQAQGFFQANRGRMDLDTANKYAERINTAVEAQGAADAATAAMGHQANTAPIGVGNAVVPTDSVSQQNRGLVKEAGASDAEADDLARIGHIEDPSGRNIKNPLPGATSYGRWQFTDATWRSLGGTAANRNDPQVQGQLALKLYRQNAAALTQALGRAPTPMESYLAWQQGPGAAKALLAADPSANAVQVLQAAGVAHAQSAIANNLPASLKAQGAGVTAGQFLQAWAGRVNNTTAAAVSAPGGNAGTNPTTGQPTGVMGAKDAVVADAVSRAPPGSSAATLERYRQVAAAAYDRQHASVTADQQDADNQLDLLWASPHPPQSIGDIPPALLQRASASKQKSVWQAFSKADDSGVYAKQSDPVTLANLASLHANNDPRLGSADLTGLASKLSAADYKMVLGWKTDALKPGAVKTPKQVSLKTAMDAANTQLNAAGFDARHHAPERAQFQTALMGEMDNWRVNNPDKEPTGSDIVKMTDYLLMNGSWQGKTGLLGPTSTRGHVFQAPAGAPITMTVPHDAAQRIVASYRANTGRDPSAMEIRQGYIRGHAAGIFR